MGKVGQLMNLHNHEHECNNDFEYSLSMEQEVYLQVSSHQQQIMDIMGDEVAYLPTAKTPRVEPRQPNLETDMECGGTNSTKFGDKHGRCRR